MPQISSASEKLLLFGSFRLFASASSCTRLMRTAMSAPEAARAVCILHAQLDAQPHAQARQPAAPSRLLRVLLRRHVPPWRVPRDNAALAACFREARFPPHWQLFDFSHLMRERAAPTAITAGDQVSRVRPPLPKLP